MNVSFNRCLGLFVVGVSLTLFVACDNHDDGDVDEDLAIERIDTLSVAGDSISISAYKLKRAYRINRIEADMLYKGKKFVVYGTIARIDKAFLSSTMYVTLCGFDCYFPDSDEQSLSVLRRGQVVLIQGVFDGWSFDHCKIVGAPQPQKP